MGLGWENMRKKMFGLFGHPTEVSMVSGEYVTWT